MRNKLKSKAKQIEENDNYVHHLNQNQEKSSNYLQIHHQSSNKIGSPYPSELKSEKSNISGIAKINQFTETVEEEKDLEGETEDEKNINADII